MKKQRCKLLLAATGSVATLKMPEMIQSLVHATADSRNYDFEIHLMVTKNAKHFIQTSKLPLGVQVYDDEREWKAWNQRGDPVLHVELGKMADLMVIAPLNSNTLGKLASGLCNNLVTSTVRAWDMEKPLLFCPAMNVRMWKHPITAQQIETLKKWGYKEVPPISKILMCGDEGEGAMAKVGIIVETILKITDEKFNHFHTYNPALNLKPSQNCKPTT